MYIFFSAKFFNTFLNSFSGTTKLHPLSDHIVFSFPRLETKGLNVHTNKSVFMSLANSRHVNNTPYLLIVFGGDLVFLY